MDFKNLSISSLMAGILFGLIGLFVFKAAKRDVNMMGITFGIALMAYPYFISNAWATWGIGIALTVMSLRVLQN